MTSWKTSVKRCTGKRNQLGNLAEQFENTTAEEWKNCIRYAVSIIHEYADLEKLGLTWWSNSHLIIDLERFESTDEAEEDCFVSPDFDDFHKNEYDFQNMNSNLDRVILD